MNRDSRLLSVYHAVLCVTVTQFSHPPFSIHNARPRRSLFTAYILIITLCTSMTLLTQRLYAFEEGGGGGGGGSSSGNSGNSDSGNSGAGTAGAYSGHETTKMIAIVSYLLKYLYTDLPLTPTPSKSTPLTEREKQFLCSMGRLRLYDSYGKNVWLPAYLAGILGRPTAVVADAMEWTSCPSRKR